MYIACYFAVHVCINEIFWEDAVDSLCIYIKRISIYHKIAICVNSFRSGCQDGIKCARDLL